MLNSSIFFLFQGSFQDSLFAISLVVDSSKVSTILSLCALKEDPVSVKSTIASTSLGVLISVAPQENSTLA